MGWPRIISSSVLNSSSLHSLLVIIILIFTNSPSQVIGEDDGHEGSSDPLDWLRASIPGEPELDYPILSQIAETSFSCSGRIFGGYYADPELQCQGYHVCLTPPNAFMDRKTSFLCPNGTIFSQSLLTCDWWFNVDCSETEEFYSINEKIGSQEPIADNDVASDSKPQSQTSQRRQQQQPRQEPKPQSQIPVPDEEEALAPQIEPQLNNIDFRQGQDQAFGVGSASIQSLNEEPQEVIDIVEYDATIPGEDDDVDVPILLADPFQEIEATEEPLALYGAPPRSGRTRSSRTRSSSGRKRSGRRGSGRRGSSGRPSRKRPSRNRSGRG